MNSFFVYHLIYPTADLVGEYYYYFTKEASDTQRLGRGWQIISVTLLIGKNMQLRQSKGEKIYTVSWFQKDLTQSIMMGEARLWERVCKRYLYHPAEEEVSQHPSTCRGGSVTCKGLPGHLLPPAKSHSAKASQPSTHHHGLGIKAWKLLAHEKTFKIQIQGRMARKKQH